MDAKVRILLSAMILAAGILGLAAGGCSRDPGPEVWVIGLDGADWDQLDPLIARGDLPNLAKLRREGAAGILRSDMPMISPILWNSIATGKTPDLHGVTWFMTDGPDGAKMPVSSAERRVRTFWNIASEAGLTCGIVGWWATWPADPINGFLVSDFVARHSFGVTGRRAVDDGKTWPADLVDLVDRIMLSPLDIPDGELQAMIHLPAAELQPDPAADPFADPVAHLRQTMATSRGYTDIVLGRLRQERPQLMSVYYEGTDAVTHLFGDYRAPRLPWISAADHAAYRDVVDAYWKWQDALVGELLAERGPRTTVIVVSDHGFRIGDERLMADGFDIETADADHMPDGIIIVNGPDVLSGTDIVAANLYDVAPTVLHAMGLPVAADMHGRVLTDAFSDESLRTRPVAIVPTYETSPLARAGNVAGDPAAGEGLSRMLKSLGYVGGGDDDEGTPSQNPEHAVNLATVLMRQDRSAEAVVELRQALAEHPGHREIRLNLAQALARSGDTAGAERIYRELVSEAPEHLDHHQDLAICLSQSGDWAGALAAIDVGLAVDPDWVGGLAARGFYLSQLGRTVEARKVLERAVKLDPRHAGAFYHLGEVLIAAGEPDRAVAALEEAHELDPGSKPAALGLVAVLKEQRSGGRALEVLQRTLALGGEDADLLAEMGAVLIMERRPAEAVAPLEKSRELAPDNADFAGNLGMAYAMTGDLPAAIRSFRDVVSLRPDLADGHAQLGALYLQNNRFDEAARELRAAIDIVPGNAQFRFILGAIHHRAGRLDQARQAYRQAIRLNPELASACYNLGVLENRAGDPAKGHELIERARELDPTLPMP